MGKKRAGGFGCRLPRSKSGKAFTLVELLIVVVIIGVLAALILPRFSTQPERMKTSEAISIMSTIRRGLLSYYDEHMDWPAAADMDTLSEIDAVLDASFVPSTYNWSFSAAPSGTTCIITADNAATNGVITLNVETGEWAGTGDYAPDGQYFPYFPS